MREKLPDIGTWVLPQPKEAYDDDSFVPIPYLKRSKYIPFGYKVSETDPDVLDPIPQELKALEQAKQYIKRYSSRHVAVWLKKVTGRYISHTGLLKRIKDEGRTKRRSQALREWARRLEKAISVAKKYEKTKGCKEKSTKETQTQTECTG
tara:strand:- start:679 stop:1128 length:450 start_codon:yes stop_codon:yes gene_type:complete